jgi:hypothetical protein
MAARGHQQQNDAHSDESDQRSVEPAQTAKTGRARSGQRAALRPAAGERRVR